MVSRTHEVGAAAALLTAAYYFPPQGLNLATVIAVGMGNVVGSLLPDLDQASNRLWDLLPGGNFIGGILRNVFLGHRTISHSLLGIFLVYRFLGWIIPQLLNQNFVNGNLVTMAIMIGYGSHLVLDSLTEEGLPLFWPFKWKFGIPPIRSWRIKTGHWFENWIVFPGIMVYIGWLLWLHGGEMLAAMR